MPNLTLGYKRQVPTANDKLTCHPEFSHIEINVVRNPSWLKQRHPFFLSEQFPIATFELPKRFANMTEDDLTNLKIWIKTHMTHFLRLKEETEE